VLRLRCTLSAVERAGLARQSAPRAPARRRATITVSAFLELYHHRTSTSTISRLVLFFLTCISAIVLYIAQTSVCFMFRHVLVIQVCFDATNSLRIVHDDRGIAGLSSTTTSTDFDHPRDTKTLLFAPVSWSTRFLRTWRRAATPGIPPRMVTMFFASFLSVRQLTAQRSAIQSATRI
jgi:hypothetical protein